MGLWARVVAIGSAWGVLCAVGNQWSVTSTFVQMAVPWLWVAAVVGFRSARGVRGAAVAGAATLTSANVVYFAVGAIASLVSDQQALANPRFLLVWTAVGLIMGPTAAVLGRLSASASAAPFALLALAAASMAEPLALWGHIDHVDAHITYSVVALVGLSIPVAVSATPMRKRWGLTASAVLVTYPVALLLEVVLIGLGQISAPVRLI